MKTKQQIVDKLNSEDFITNSLVHLHKVNGFNDTDFKIMTSITQFYLKNKSLTQKHFKFLRSALPKYWQQLLFVSSKSNALLKPKKMTPDEKYCLLSVGGEMPEPYWQGRVLNVFYDATIDDFDERIEEAEKEFNPEKKLVTVIGIPWRPKIRGMKPRGVYRQIPIEKGEDECIN